MTGETDVIRWGLGPEPGVLVTLEDARLLERDLLLGGNAYVAPTDSWIGQAFERGSERVYRRIDPDRVTTS